MIAALASQNCYFETTIQDLFENWLDRDCPWPAFTSSLGLSEIETGRS